MSQPLLADTYQVVKGTNTCFIDGGMDGLGAGVQRTLQSVERHFCADAAKESNSAYWFQGIYICCSPSLLI